MWYAWIMEPKKDKTACRGPWFPGLGRLPDATENFVTIDRPADMTDEEWRTLPIEPGFGKRPGHKWNP